MSENHHCKDLPSVYENSADESRLKWEQTYGAWFPAAQKCRNCHIDRVYREIREKYGDELFRSYARERRLNKRIFLDPELKLEDQDEYTVFKSLQPFVINGSLPTIYFEEKCAEPTPCLNFCKKVQDPSSSS